VAADDQVWVCCGRKLTSVAARDGSRCSCRPGGRVAGGEPELPVTVEVRHARADSRSEDWHVGGLFKTISPDDHQRVVRYIFDQLTSLDRL
jgi:hypothetical protein